MPILQIVGLAAATGVFFRPLSPGSGKEDQTSELPSAVKKTTTVRARIF